MRIRIRIQQLKLMRIHADPDPDTDPDPKPWKNVLKNSKSEKIGLYFAKGCILSLGIRIHRYTDIYLKILDPDLR